MNDSSKTIVRSATLFLSGTLLSRVSGLLRDMAMAFAFGTSSSVAALMVAFRFAHLFRRVLGEGAMQSAFIPRFEEIRKSSGKRASQFFCDLTLLLSALLFFLTLSSSLLLYISYRWVNSSSLREILSLTTLLMPSLYFICLYGINSALLQCEKSYFLPSAAPVIFNLVWVAGALSFASYGAEEAVHYLALSIVAACAGQWLITLPPVLSVAKKEGAIFSIRKIFSKEIYSEDIAGLAPPLLLGIAGVAATQINSALDPLFARIADPEGPAYLWYAMRLQQLPLSLFAVAFSSALLPPLSRAAKKGDDAAFRYFLSLSIKRCLLFILPATAAYFAFGDGIVNLLFGFGDFGHRSIIFTTKALFAYSFGLLPSSIVILLAPAFYARGDYRTPAMATAVAVAVNVALNTLFVTFFGWGAASVAAATAIASWVNLAILSASLYNVYGVIFGKRECSLVGGVFAASIAALFVAVAAEYSFYGASGCVAILFGESFSFPAQLSGKVVHLAVCTVAFSLPLLLWFSLEWRNGLNGRMD